MFQGKFAKYPGHPPRKMQKSNFMSQIQKKLPKPYEIHVPNSNTVWGLTVWGLQSPATNFGPGMPLTGLGASNLGAYSMGAYSLGAYSLQPPILGQGMPLTGLGAYSLGPTIWGIYCLGANNLQPPISGQTCHSPV